MTANVEEHTQARSQDFLKGGYVEYVWVYKQTSRQD